MHVESYNQMARLVNTHLQVLRGAELGILDVGSYDVNGTYKPLFAQPGWRYTGADMVAGPNVDLVLPPKYNWTAIPDNRYDVVISGQILEHVTAPWLMVKEIARVCKPGGMIFIIVPWIINYHPYPIDCWRISHDGMHYLMVEHCALVELECRIYDIDTIWAGFKPSCGDNIVDVV